MAAPWFDVRAGERHRVARTGGALFAILAAHTISETVRDSVFLRTGTASQLSLAYLGLAAVAVIALAGNRVLVQQLGRRYALIATLMAAAFGTSLFYLVHPGPAAAFALYMWTGLLGTLVVVQFWLLAATVFTSSEAKRLYGLMAALGALGALAGALAASGLLLLVRDVEQLLPLAAGLYLLAALLLSSEDGPASAAAEAADETFREQMHRPKRQRLRDHPYASRLAAILVFATMAALISDYLLKTTAAEASADSRQLDLPQFFAGYNGVVSAVSLIFQVFGASWLLRKAGVLGSILMLPLLMLAGGIASVMTAGAFLAAVSTKGADATLRHSVNRVANELLWMPVPDDVRTAIRERLESVAVRLVQAGTAGLLLGLATIGWATPTVLAALVVGVAALWIAVAGGLRPAYLAQLRTSLSRPMFEPDTELDLASLEVVVEALSSTDDRRVIAAIQVLASHQRGRLIPALVLRHDSLEVLRVALDAIARTDRNDWIPLTKRLLQTANPQIRIAAIRALASAGVADVIATGLRDPDPSVRAAAVFWQHHTGPSARLIDEPEVAALLAGMGVEAEQARRHLLEAIRNDGDRRWADVLASLARVGDNTTIETVALAIARVPDPRFVPILVGRLGTRAGRASVRTALVAIGDAALTALEEALRLPMTPPRIRLHLPTTIALFGTRRAGGILVAQLAQERSGAVRYRLLRAIARLAVNRGQRFDADLLLDEMRHHLRQHFRLLGLTVPLINNAEDLKAALITAPHGAVSLDARAGGSSGDENTDSQRLLRGLLQDKASQALDRVFLALQALHPHEDIRGIERALGGTDRGARAHALEFLDTVTRAPMYLSARAAGIREDLLLVGEDLDARERVTRAGDGDDVPATALEALTRLVKDADSLLAACAAYYALQLGDPALTAMVNEVARTRHVLAPLGIVHAAFYEPAAAPRSLAP